MFSFEILKNTFFKRTSPVAASASRDAKSTCKSLADVWTWEKVQTGCFGIYVTVTLFSREQCHQKYMEKRVL